MDFFTGLLAKIKRKVSGQESTESTKKVLDYERAVRVRNLRADNQFRDQPNLASPKDYVYNGIQEDNFIQKVKNIPRATTTPSPTRVPSKAPTRMPTRTPTPTVNPQDWEELKTFFANEADKRGYSKSALISQKAVESARGKSDFAVNRQNYGGIGARDSDPNQALSFKNPEEYMDYYDKMIQKNFPEAYKVRNDPIKYLTSLKKGGRIGVYATDPQYVEKITNTPEYRYYDK